MDGRYQDGIAAMHALGHDDNPEIANYLGYASRKLGRYDEAKFWYEKALAADPNHVRTWSYYGMWHAEQGNLLMAQDYLEKVRSICGNTDCEEYKERNDVIEGTQTYCTVSVAAPNCRLSQFQSSARPPIRPHP